jgi:iduronate 2-sulfatase
MILINIKIKFMIKHIPLLFLSFFLLNGCTDKEKKPPNILLIMIDDLNDYNEDLNGHPQVITPNIKNFAKSAVSFKNAYSNDPMCGPSRSSMLLGVYPHNSSNFWQKSWLQNEVLSNTKTIMEKFKENDYNVIGSGKILHHNKNDLWSEFEHQADYSPIAYLGEWERGKKGIAHPSVPKPYRTIKELDGLNMAGGAIDGSYGPLTNLDSIKIDGKQVRWAYGPSRQGKTFNYIDEDNRDLTPDEINANWAEKRLLELASSDNDNPFFLAVGFLRPHTPLIVPKKYFDMYPLENIQLAKILENDKEDTYLHTVSQFETPGRSVRSIEMYKNLVSSYYDDEEGLKRFTQAYLACVTAVDDNIGQVLSAVNNSNLKDNTIVVIVSDHGWTMGEKEHVYKNSLWEESTRVPFLIRAPGISKADSKVYHPVSLIDVYPTLLDLAGLDNETIKNEKGKSLDGFSLKPFLNNPELKDWEGPDAALSVVYTSDKNAEIPSNHHYSVRTKDWRYILYNTGEEELYNNANDPKEWNNLIFEKKHPKTKEMRKILKEITSPIIPQGFSNIK